eukprot:2975612-Alexandrium_andersonii.AAC.1
MVIHNGKFIVEQPSSSVFEMHVRWAWLSALLGSKLHRIHVWMNSYGGSSPKPTLLYSNMPDILNMCQTRNGKARATVNTVRRYTDVNGKARVVGTPQLKGTQAYPVQFGKE